MAETQIKFQVHSQVDIAQINKLLSGLLSKRTIREIRGGQIITLPSNQILKRRRPQLERFGTFIEPTPAPMPRLRTATFTARRDLNAAELRKLQGLLRYIADSSIQPGESVSLKVGLRLMWSESKLRRYGQLC